MPIAETTITAALTEAAKQAVIRLASSISNIWGDKKAADNAIRVHLNEVRTWSADTDFFGSKKGPISIDNTLELHLCTSLRKFGPLQRTADISELDVLTDTKSYLILGDPGGGKSTTLKRIARRCVSSLTKSEQRPQRLPIVIRLRRLEHRPLLMLHCGLANALGILYEQDKQDPNILYCSHGNGGKHLLKNVIPSILDSFQAVLILDGLDELEDTARDRIKDELEDILKRTTKTKVICSSRSGDYVRAIQKLVPIEVLPLDEELIRLFARRWVDRDTEFLECLRKLPYSDVANRPVLLVQLGVIFNRYGQLPQQPIHIYRKLTLLLLQEWDAQNNVKRTSRYSRFEPEQKHDFLAALAHALTVIVRSKQFTDSDLKAAYLAICSRFNLPPAEAKLVVEEIETHTGILTPVGEYEFEFCHLSLQEYLCADYIVKAPHSDKSHLYFTNYPHPLAVAVAMSSCPGEWFGRLVLAAPTPIENYRGSIFSFLSRLVVEAPAFEESIVLGFAFLRLWASFPERQFNDIAGRLRVLLNSDTVYRSLALALREYVVPLDAPLLNEQVRLALADGTSARNENSPAKAASVPKDVALNLCQQFSCIRVKEADGTTHLLYKTSPWLAAAFTSCDDYAP